jgi:hypothetical protein
LFSLTALVLAQTGAATRRGIISGRVVSEDGQPVDGAMVTCNGFDGRSAGRTVTTDGEGRFSFAGLPPAAYQVNSYSPGYVTSSMNDTLIARIGDTLTLTLVKGGVVTGRVANSSGEPVVGVQVTAYRVRDAEGRALRSGSAVRTRQTDDRGIYRIYGLAAGSYHVLANPMSADTFTARANDLETPTYYPSSNREGATEVAVQQGAEVAGIDIRYRDTQGHTISGTVEGGPEGTPEYGMRIEVQPAGGGPYSGGTFARSVGGVRTFFINGVPDGEYDLIGGGSISQEEAMITTLRRVTVRGSDVSGVKLTMMPLASIAGKVSVEALAPRPETCPKARETVVGETFFRAQRDEKSASTEVIEPFPFFRSSGAVSEKGDFLLKTLKAGPYRLTVDLPSDDWYVKAMTTPGATAARRIDLSRGPVTLKPGEKLSDITVTIAEGAAAISGKLSGEKVRRGRWRVHLIPIEVTQAENALVYYEAIAASDGGFSLTHLAPGKYWILSRPLPEDQVVDSTMRPVAWDATERAKLRRDAEAAKIEIELKLCGRVKDYVLAAQ